MAGTDIVVFAGSSLAPADRRLLDACYQPPAQQGDVIEAVELARPRAIALIDGLFLEVPAVRHREILWALARGVRVYGAASMGALRAAELAPHGMVGVGLVYRWYRSAWLAGDDEVAQALGPAELGFPPLSEALIEMRLTFRRAQRAGLLTPDLRRSLERSAKAIFYRDRTYQAAIARAQEEAAPDDRAALDGLAAWLPAHRVPQKQRDAAALIRRLVHEVPTRAQEKPGARADLITTAWREDLRTSGLGHLLD